MSFMGLYGKTPQYPPSQKGLKPLQVSLLVVTFLSIILLCVATSDDGFQDPLSGQLPLPSRQLSSLSRIPSSLTTTSPTTALERAHMTISAPPIPISTTLQTNPFLAHCTIQCPFMTTPDDQCIFCRCTNTQCRHTTRIIPVKLDLSASTFQHIILNQKSRWINNHPTQPFTTFHHRVNETISYFLDINYITNQPNPSNRFIFHTHFSPMIYEPDEATLESQHLWPVNQTHATMSVILHIEPLVNMKITDINQIFNEYYNALRALANQVPKITAPIINSDGVAYQLVLAPISEYEMTVASQYLDLYTEFSRVTYCSSTIPTGSNATIIPNIDTTLIYRECPIVFPPYYTSFSPSLNTTVLNPLYTISPCDQSLTVDDIVKVPNGDSTPSADAFAMKSVNTINDHNSFFLPPHGHDSPSKSSFNTLSTEETPETPIQPADPTPSPQPLSSYPYNIFTMNVYCKDPFNIFHRAPNYTLLMTNTQAPWCIPRNTIHFPSLQTFSTCNEALDPFQPFSLRISTLTMAVYDYNNLIRRVLVKSLVGKNEFNYEYRVNQSKTTIIPDIILDTIQPYTIIEAGTKVYIKWDLNSAKQYTNATITLILNDVDISHQPSNWAYLRVPNMTHIVIGQYNVFQEYLYFTIPTHAISFFDNTTLSYRPSSIRVLLSNQMLQLQVMQFAVIIKPSSWVCTRVSCPAGSACDPFIGDCICGYTLPTDFEQLQAASPISPDSLGSNIIPTSALNAAILTRKTPIDPPDPIKSFFAVGYAESPYNICQPICSDSSTCGYGSMCVAASSLSNNLVCNCAARVSALPGDIQDVEHPLLLRPNCDIAVCKYSTSFCNHRGYLAADSQSPASLTPPPVCMYDESDPFSTHSCLCTVGYFVGETCATCLLDASQQIRFSQYDDDTLIFNNPNTGAYYNWLNGGDGTSTTKHNYRNRQCNPLGTDPSSYQACTSCICLPGFRGSYCQVRVVYFTMSLLYNQDVFKKATTSITTANELTAFEDEFLGKLGQIVMYGAGMISDTQLYQNNSLTWYYRDARPPKKDPAFLQNACYRDGKINIYFNSTDNTTSQVGSSISYLTDPNWDSNLMIDSNFITDFISVTYALPIYTVNPTEHIAIDPIANAHYRELYVQNIYNRLQMVLARFNLDLPRLPLYFPIKDFFLAKMNALPLNHAFPVVFPPSTPANSSLNRSENEDSLDISLLQESAEDTHKIFLNMDGFWDPICNYSSTTPWCPNYPNPFNNSESTNPGGNPGNGSDPDKSTSGSNHNITTVVVCILVVFAGLALISILIFCFGCRSGLQNDDFHGDKSSLEMEETPPPQGIVPNVHLLIAVQGHDPNHQSFSNCSRSMITPPTLHGLPLTRSSSPSMRLSTDQNNNSTKTSEGRNSRSTFSFNGNGSGHDGIVDDTPSPAPHLARLGAKTVLVHTQPVPDLRTVLEQRPHHHQDQRLFNHYLTQQQREKVTAENAQRLDADRRRLQKEQDRSRNATFADQLPAQGLSVIGEGEDESATISTTCSNPTRE